MSIELLIDRYCENCPHFEVEQDTTVVRSLMSIEILQPHHSLRCKNAEVCKLISKHLREEMAGEE